MAIETAEFLKKLSSRKKESHVYRKYQLTGLEIADILGDRAHKALYIKLAKERDAELLRALAKDIADKPNVANKGAYFMACLGKMKNGNELKIKMPATSINEKK
ncbi:MAG: hypothetical protein NUV53_03795 [Patescibacteria group bacterium]|nr:hypothetical protein [Patescibacteria group bacterium]